MDINSSTAIHLINIGNMNFKKNVPKVNAWWAENIRRGVITSGYNDNPSKKKLAKSYFEEKIKVGDLIFAFSAGIGMVGVGIAGKGYQCHPHVLESSLTDHCIEREVDWAYAIHDVSRAITLAELKPFDITFTLHTYRRLDKITSSQVKNLIELIKQRAEEDIAVKVDSDDVIVDFSSLPHYRIGQLYNRQQDITGRFGGSGQSGIAPSRQAPAVFLFTGGSGEQYGYTDHVDPITGHLSYTGEGQVGDMQMTGGNKAIANHAMEGRALHVFEALGKGKPYRYMGEFAYSTHKVIRGPDKNGADRAVIVFELLPVGSPQIEALQEEGEVATKETQQAPKSLAELRQAAVDACDYQKNTTGTQASLRTVYQRSEQVKQYVLARSQGNCELCAKPAPFRRKRDGTPYLEPHHINRLSDGGLDHPKYVGAICPSCHREIHYGINGAALNEQLRINVIAAEEQADAIAISS